MVRLNIPTEDYLLSMIDLDKLSLFEGLKNALTPLDSELQELEKCSNATRKKVMSITAKKLSEQLDNFNNNL